MDLDRGKILNTSKCSVLLGDLDERNSLLPFLPSQVSNDLKPNMILRFTWLNAERTILNPSSELTKRDCKLPTKTFSVLGSDRSREGQPWNFNIWIEFVSQCTTKQIIVMYNAGNPVNILITYHHIPPRTSDIILLSQ